MADHGRDGVEILKLTRLDSDMLTRQKARDGSDVPMGARIV